MLDIREVLATEILDEAQPLMLAHWEEVAKATGAPKPNISRAHLEALENVGAVVTLGVFDGEELVGYSLNLIGPPIDFADMKVMQNEGIFIRQDHRGKVALRLISESERIAKERGATRALWHTYLDTRASDLFSRLPGYTVYDRPYSKEL